MMIKIKNTSDMIVGLCGKKQAGKSTVAFGLVNEGFVELSFAGPLKRACAAIFGFTDEQLNGALKEVPDVRWGVSPRQVMQRFGTDLMRKYSDLVVPIKNPEDFWLVVMSKRIAAIDTKHIVISDVRFQNEANQVREFGGIVVRIERPAAASPASDSHASDMHASDMHASEADDFPADFVVVNDGTPSELLIKVLKIMSVIQDVVAATS